MKPGRAVSSKSPPTPTAFTDTSRAIRTMTPRPPYDPSYLSRDRDTRIETITVVRSVTTFAGRNRRWRRTSAAMQASWPGRTGNTTPWRAACRQGGVPRHPRVEGTDVRQEDLARGHLPRVMVTGEMNPGAGNLDWLYPRRHKVLAAQADLDAVYDPDPAIFRGRVDRLVQKIRASGANTVFLQGLADPAGDGHYREAYFMNHQLPLRADIWSMVAHKFRHAGFASGCGPRITSLGMGAPPSGASPSARNAGRRLPSRGTSASPRSSRGHGRRRSTFSATSPSTSPLKGSSSTTTPT